MLFHFSSTSWSVLLIQSIIHFFILKGFFRLGLRQLCFCLFKERVWRTFWSWQDGWRDTKFFEASLLLTGSAISKDKSSFGVFFNWSSIWSCCHCMTTQYFKIIAWPGGLLSQYLFCAKIMPAFLFTLQFVRKIGSKALQCSVFQYLLGLLKSDEMSRSSVSKRNTLYSSEKMFFSVVSCVRIVDVSQ